MATLEAADHGKLDELIALFAALQKEQFVLALGLARDVLQENRAEEIIVRTGKELARRKDALKKEWETAKDKAEALRIEAKDSLEKLVHTLESQTEPAVEKSVFFVDGAADHQTKSHYFHRQIVETAKTLNYLANTSTYRSWVRIVLKTDGHGEILISFHGIGHEFRGKLACTATWFQRVNTEDGEREVTSATALSDDLFQINYKEDLDQISGRFRNWLDDSMITGLNRWQKSVL